MKLAKNSMHSTDTLLPICEANKLFLNVTLWNISRQKRVIPFFSDVNLFKQHVITTQCRFGLLLYIFNICTFVRYGFTRDFDGKIPPTPISMQELVHTNQVSLLKYWQQHLFAMRRIEGAIEIQSIFSE